MSSKRRRARKSPQERRTRLQSEIEKKGTANNDSIEKIMDELLHRNTENAKSVATVQTRAQENNPIFGCDVDGTTCEHCRSYFPLLKSFILHLESHHKGTATDEEVQVQICELCKIEFDGPITLGMHLLLHIYGRMPTKEVEISTLAAVLQGSAQQKGPSERSELEKSNADSNQMATRMYTRLLEQSAKDTLAYADSEERADIDIGEPNTRSEVSCSNDIPVNGSRKSETGSFLNQALGVEKRLSNLFPPLQVTETDVTDNIIRPRECSSSSIDKETTIDNAVDEQGFSNELSAPDRDVNVQRDSIAVQNSESMEQIAASQFVIDQNTLSESGDYSLTDSTPDSKSSQLLSEKRRRNAENQCIFCLKKFSTKELLKQHRLEVHGDKEKWACSDCSREFSSHWKYRDHCVKMHDNKKPFKCGECGKSLSSFTILATHENLHSGARPHECEICGKRYLVAAGLKDHLIAHKNEREHRCVVCNSGFNAKGDLKKHMVTHLPEKPHCCNICNTGFNRSASLRRHLRTHTGEKPFKCDLCGKAFSRKEKMHEHRRTHTGERPLICNVCGKSFKDSSNFSNHRRIHQAGYVPRKRKRTTAKAQSINSVVIPPDQPVVPAPVTVQDIGLLSNVGSMIPGKLPNLNGKENALKDLATITTTIEDLQSASQEWLRQLLGAALDQTDIRNLMTVPGAVSFQGNQVNLSAEDIRSLQSIVNGVQARTGINTGESSSNVTQ